MKRIRYFPWPAGPDPLAVHALRARLRAGTRSVLKQGERVRLATMALFALVLAAALVPAERAFAQTPPAAIAIAGKVERGAAGEAGLAGLSVDLYVLVADEVRDQVRTTTDEAGRFRFERTPASADERYRVVAEYLDVPYVSDELSGGQEDLVLRAFELTRDPGVVRIERLGLLVTVDESSQSVLVIETAALVNDGDRTYLPEVSGSGMPANLLRFGLPAGAADLSPFDGIAPEQMIQVERGFAALVPVRPGRQDFSFSYRVPYRSSATSLELSVPVPTADVRALIPESGVSVTSAELAQQPSVERLGRRYLQLAGKQLPAGSRITLNLADLPLSFRGYDVRAVQIAAVLLALTGLGFLGFYVERRARAVAAGGPASAALEADRRELIAELVQLDGDYAAGGIGGEEYEAARSELKAQLIDVLRQVRSGAHV